MVAKRLLVIALVTCLWVVPSAGYCADTNQALTSDSETGEPDPLAWFNEPMFTFNLKLDKYVAHPVASGWAWIIPLPGRQSVDKFFNNINVIPRFLNSIFQLRLDKAGGELARFAINSTMGVGGFFDPADDWFGLKQYNTDFGLTLSQYGVKGGDYLVLPLFGPSNVRDTVGRVVDGSMNPVSYLSTVGVLPVWAVFAIIGGEQTTYFINYRSLNLDLFNEVDRYSVDLYGAAQDAYIQRRRKKEAEMTF